MTDPQDNREFDPEKKAAPLDTKLETIIRLATAIVEGHAKLTEIATGSFNGLTEIKEKIMPMLQRLSSEQDKLRGMLLSKMDGSQRTMDLVREDTRNA